MSRESTCKFCGARGREEANDPAPGVCPDCLDERMKAATERLARRVQEIGLPLAFTRTGLELVTEVGLTREAAGAFLQRMGDLITGRGERIQ